MFKLVPSFTEPLLGGICSKRILSSVDLPTPLFPIRPIRSPLRILRLMLLKSLSSPYPCESFRASITFFPDFSDNSILILAFPWRVERCRRYSRIAVNARTRPSFLVRLALMP